MGQTVKGSVGIVKAKVSVILPSLNVVDYIKECMDSAVNQSLQELEIICIDAGSTDGTREVLAEYARRDSRITVLESDKKSYGRQVNIGLEHASGEYAAVLETDDWIERDMYQTLYECASKDRLDYAAADFDTFYQLQSGSYYFVRQHLFWGEQRDWYGRILNGNQIARLRASDYVLWKGIYNREFLNTHHIRLHESAGAAFQDMGFLQQVKTYAARARYIDKSFYRYRQGREGASSNGLEGLRFYQKEFWWMDDSLRLTGLLKGVHKKYYYYTMSISLLTKYEQILVSLNGNWQDKRLSEPYFWFRAQLTRAVSEGLLDETMYVTALWDRLMLLLTSQEAHAGQVMEAHSGKEKCVQEFLRKTKRRPVVVFGCGVRGERLMLFCDRNQIRMHAYCDNDTAVQGRKKFGFPVLSPEELRTEVCDKNEAVVLSMKKGTKQVREQLVCIGIEEDRIIDELPEGMI